MAIILVVEDNSNNRRLLRDVLTHHGHEVLEATNGRLGVDMARSLRPDIVLMDVHMPVMDGVEACRLLKTEADTRDLPVVAVTSCAMKGDRERMLSLGFDGYISKPLDTRKLPQQLAAILEGGP